MMVFVRRLAATSLLCFSATLIAADKPLWELGMGVGGLSMPAYRGADQHRDWLFPVPYFV